MSENRGEKEKEENAGEARGTQEKGEAEERGRSRGREKGAEAEELRPR